MEAPLFTQQGTKKGGVALPATIFELPWNEPLVHQIIVGMHANERAAIAHTKDRSEVRGGGKKPWQQKGTGRARHGSIRSPIWTGGGVAHGPRNQKDHSKILTKGMKAKAFATVLSAKAQQKTIACIESLAFAAPKTKDAKVIVAAIKKEMGIKGGAFVLVLPKNETAIRKSFQNIPRTTITTADGLNSKVALGAKAIVFVDPKESFAILEKRVA